MHMGLVCWNEFQGILFNVQLFSTQLINSQFSPGKFSFLLPTPKIRLKTGIRKR